jgi:hypothetical protein
MQASGLGSPSFFEEVAGDLPHTCGRLLKTRTNQITYLALVLPSQLRP